MDFEYLINEKCCACGKTLKENGEHVNGVILDKYADWTYPTAKNIITGEKGRALSIVCDQCIEKRAVVKYAIKIEGEKVEYMLINTLEDIPEDRKYLV